MTFKQTLVGNVTLVEVKQATVHVQEIERAGWRSSALYWMKIDVNSDLAVSLQLKKPSSNYFLVSPFLYSHLLHPLWPFNWMWQQSNVSVSISLIERWRSLPAVVLQRTLIPEKAKARVQPLELAWLLTAPNWLHVWGCDASRMWHKRLDFFCCLPFVSVPLTFPFYLLLCLFVFN